MTTESKLIEDMKRAYVEACLKADGALGMDDAMRVLLAVAFPAIRERCAEVAEQNGTAFSGQAAFIAKEILALSLDAPPSTKDQPG